MSLLLTYCGHSEYQTLKQRSQTIGECFFFFVSVVFDCSCVRDEDAPAKIPDPDATKPDEWNEDEPEYIDDPDASKPSDW